VVALNLLAIILGWTIIVFATVAVTLIVVIGAWHWLMDEIWLAGERIQRLRRNRAAKRGE